MLQVPDCYCRSLGLNGFLTKFAALAVVASVMGWHTGSATLMAQPGAKAAAKKDAPAAKPAAKPAAPATKPSPAKSADPATPEQAAKVLDLRTFPVMKDAKVSDMRTLGMLMYEVVTSAKGAFEFQRKELTKLGFKEQPGGYSDENTVSGHFMKDGFHVGVSTYASSGDPKKMGVANVTLINDGNVDAAQLPVPPGVKPFYPQPHRGAYTTDAKVAPTAAACRKLLLAAGWEPYGQVEPNANQPDSSTQYFKRNAIKLHVWVSVTPADGGKTLIQYSTELYQTDLPAPTDIANPEYTDFQKTLRFDAPKDQTDAILDFYQQRLPKMGWKATTDKPITDDRDKSQFVIYRNEQKELLSLDLKQFTDIVRVKLSHQTAAELAEEERLAKAAAEKKKAEETEQNKKVNVALPLPADAGEIDKLKENVFEIKFATGTCPAAMESFRKHFLKQGWTEEKGTKLDEKIGSMTFKKGLANLTFSYFDIGFGDAEIKVAGSPNVVLETAEATDKPETDKPETDESKPKDEPKAKAKKKPAIPAIPGLPDLPPGVELPDDVKDLLKKNLPPQKKAPAPEKKADE